MRSSESARTLVEDVLASAAEDWVDPLELLGVVRKIGANHPEVLRDAAVGLLARLVEADLVVIGDVSEKHIPWSCSSGEAVLRVAREWAKFDDPLSVMPGQIFWLDTTPAGQRLGEAVWAREAQER